MTTPRMESETTRHENLDSVPNLRPRYKFWTLEHNFEQEKLSPNQFKTSQSSIPPRLSKYLILALNIVRKKILTVSSMDKNGNKKIFLGSFDDTGHIVSKKITTKQVIW